jgi:nucleoid DNA-binding protein
MERLTFPELVESVSAASGVDDKTTRAVIEHLRDEVIGWAAEGYSVSIPRLVKFQVRHQPAKRKGELVRNPATGEMAPRKEGVPESFKLKAFALPTASEGLPTAKTKEGKALKEAIGVA